MWIIFVEVFRDIWEATAYMLIKFCLLRQVHIRVIMYDQVCRGYTGEIN